MKACSLGTESKKKSGTELSRSIESNSNAKVAVFLWNGIGDCWLSVPTLRALAEEFPSQVMLIMPSYLHNVLPQDLYELPSARIPEEWGRAERRSQSELQSILGEDFSIELFINLSPWRSPFLDQIEHHFRSRSTFEISTFHLSNVAGGIGNEHYADFVFQVAKYVQRTQSEKDFFQLQIAMRDEFRNKADRLSQVFPDDCKLLCVHNHSSEERKRWDTGRLFSCLDSFTSIREEYLAIIVDPTEYQIPLHLNNRIFSMTGLRLGTVAAFVEKCDLFLGVDSCMLHMADMCKVPSVGLFGPTRPENWGFRFSNGSTVEAKQMNQIPSQKVLNKLLSIAR